MEQASAFACPGTIFLRSRVKFVQSASSSRRDLSPPERCRASRKVYMGIELLVRELYLAVPVL